MDHICRLTDKCEIRRRLQTDPAWSLYALADLDDGLFEQCDWSALGESLALVFHGLPIRPIFVMGDATSTRELLHSLPETTGYLTLQPDQLEGPEIYYFRERHEMRRMLLEDFSPAKGKVETLSRRDEADILCLKASGGGAGIAFAPFQLDTGFFRGVRWDGELVAVAGVHAVSRNESVAAVGNVFTRPDCRGQGLARMVTSAVVTALREAGIGTIGLNVEHTNKAAIHIYEQLGFRARLTYFEGVADRIL